VALATLTVVVPVGGQDTSRLCLTRALLAGRLSADGCLAGSVDRASHHGHLYSDKAPGMSVLAVPAAAAVRLPAPSRWRRDGDLRVWAVRLLTGGAAFLLVVFLVGRVAEGLAPGAGARTLVVCGAGTLLGATAVGGFEHDTAAACGFAAFLFAWRRRPLRAGLAAGLAVLVAYEAAIVALLVGLYVLADGLHAGRKYLLGLVPGAVALGAYDWAAFGSPLHLSYRYKVGENASSQSSGFFGMHLPTLHGSWSTLLGDRGLPVESPVLVAAVLGLALLWRRGYRREAALAAAVSLVFLLLEVGYFSPYGGDSPGPRFLIPALPFAALGLAVAFDEWPAATGLLGGASVLATSVVTVTWPSAVNSASSGYRGGAWGEIGRLLTEGETARITGWPAHDVLHWLGMTNGLAACLSVACACAAAGVALVPPNVWPRFTLGRAESTAE
jgi:hypothetical protein